MKSPQVMRFPMFYREEQGGLQVLDPQEETLGAPHLLTLTHVAVQVRVEEHKGAGQRVRTV